MVYQRITASQRTNRQPTSPTRGGGKTTAMILTLPADKSRIIIVVHNASTRTYIRNLIRAVRPDIHPNQYNVVIIQQQSDMERFRGLDHNVKVFADHAWRETVDSSVSAELELSLNYRGIKLG